MSIYNYAGVNFPRNLSVQSILQNHRRYSSTLNGKKSMISCKHECMGEVMTIIERILSRGYTGFDDCNVDSLSEFRLVLLLFFIFISLFFVDF